MCVLCVSTALLPPGSTQHVASSTAAAAGKPAARRGVISGNDIPMITELGQSLSQSVIPVFSDFVDQYSALYYCALNSK